MTKNELSQILNEMYNNAPDGEQVSHIHLFGVKYATQILQNNYKVTDIVKLSGVKPSYSTEVSKGVRLSKYVVPKI